MYSITTEQALSFVERFENCTLPREEWTHEMHLVVGMYMIMKYEQQALPEMKKRIWRYNEIKGNGNDGTGYHETLTVFWLWVVKAFCDKNSITTFDEIGIDQLIFDEELSRRKLVEDYYHPAILMSPHARRVFDYPDLKEMKGVEYFL